MNTTEMNITEKCVEAAKNTEKIYQLGRESVLNPALKYNVVDIKDNNWKYWGQKTLEFEAWLKDMSESLSVIIHGLFKADDTKDVVDFGHMFANCDKLKIFPEINTSNGEIFDYMYSECRMMSQPPWMDTSKGKNFRHMFSMCKHAQDIPTYDTSNGEDFLGMFYGCQYATKIPPLNTRKGKNFQQFLDGCWRITGDYEFDTRNGTNFYAFARNCQQMTGLTIDVSNATSIASAFNNCSALVRVEFSGDIPVSISFGSSKKLPAELVRDNIIYKLRDYSKDANNINKHTITLHSDVWWNLDNLDGYFVYRDKSNPLSGYVYCQTVDSYLSQVGWLRA